MVVVPVAGSLASYGGFTGHIFTALAMHLATVAALTANYRLSPVHALAGYPGPLIARFSSLWMAYIASTGKRHLYMMKLHETYGPIVRIGPNLVSIVDADVVKKCLGSPGMPRSAGKHAISLSIHQPH